MTKKWEFDQQDLRTCGKIYIQMDCCFSASVVQPITEDISEDI